MGAGWYLHHDLGAADASRSWLFSKEELVKIVASMYSSRELGGTAYPTKCPACSKFDKLSVAARQQQYLCGQQIERRNKSETARCWLLEDKKFPPHSVLSTTRGGKLPPHSLQPTTRGRTRLPCAAYWLIGGQFAVEPSVCCRYVVGVLSVLCCQNRRFCTCAYPDIYADAPCVVLLLA